MIGGSQVKRILITGGPTNEPIDEVMKITNMSTGGTSVSLGNFFCDAGYEVVLILNNSVKCEKRENLDIVWVENTEDMLKAIETEAKKDNVDAVIHAAAVGDYKPEFSFLMDDLAEEIYKNLGKIKSAEDILAIMENPKCKLDNSSKISSYQNNLTVKLGLTPKIIAKLRLWFPDSLLIGCKLLEGVEKGELFDVASALCNKNNMDYILANDLADLRAGRTARYLINKDGFTQIVLKDVKEIFKFVDEKLGE
jgi:phosphopantothenate---cysteine ligase (CTP)